MRTRLVRFLDAQWGTEYRKVHHMGLELPEEDEFWLATPLKSGGLWEAFPDVARFQRFFWGDERLSADEAAEVTRFYRACALRHWRHHGGAVWMSKNPMFTPRVRLLRLAFPDARFIVLVRDPRKVVPSTASLFHHAWWDLGAEHPDDQHMDRIHTICERFYRGLPAALEGLPDSQVAWVRFEDLKADTAAVLPAVLDQLGLPVTQTLRDAIADNERRGYTPTHRYSLADWGLTEADIHDRYADVMEEWGYR